MRSLKKADRDARLFFMDDFLCLCSDSETILLVGEKLVHAALPGFCVLRSASMKMNWFGGAAQINGVP